MGKSNKGRRGEEEEEGESNLQDGGGRGTWPPPLLRDEKTMRIRTQQEGNTRSKHVLRYEGNHNHTLFACAWGTVIQNIMYSSIF